MPPLCLTLGYVPGATPAKWARIWAERHPEVSLQLCSVEAVDAYTTLPAGAGDIDADIAENFRAGYYDGAVLTASSQARALPSLLGLPPPTTRVVTIGAPTAATARRQGIAVAAQASSPTSDAIVRALIDALDRPVQADAPEERDS